MKHTPGPWTREFHGITHLGICRPSTHWVTVCNYGNFSELSLWFPGCGFSPNTRIYPTVEEAKTAGEQYLSKQVME